MARSNCSVQRWSVPPGEGIALQSPPRGARFGKAAMPKISRDGVEIYYEVHGGGPALLLTHGYSSTSGIWQRQIEALSRHHKLVLWDMRGHGQSDYPDDPQSYSEALTVADMATLLDEVGAKSAIVGGLSLGGYMSLAFYRTQPDARVIELVPEIKVPSLIVVGADDTPFLAASDYMAAKIPDAKKVVIPAAGHAVNIDQPQAFIEAVLPFLDGLAHGAPKQRLVQS